MSHNTPKPQFFKSRRRHLAAIALGVSLVAVSVASFPADVSADSSVDIQVETNALAPDEAQVTYDGERLHFSYSANEVEVSHNGKGYSLATGVVTWSADIGDTFGVRLRNCGGFIECSDWTGTVFAVTEEAEVVKLQPPSAVIEPPTQFLVASGPYTEESVSSSGIPYRATTWAVGKITVDQFLEFAALHCPDAEVLVAGYYEASCEETEVLWNFGALTVVSYPAR